MYATHTNTKLPLPVTCAMFGSVAAGIVGAIVGLVIGLHVHAPTAWFAMCEIGLPAGILGGLVGLLVGVAAFVRRIIAHS